MFGLFKSKPFRDPKLGALTRSRGHWRGAIAIASKSVPLALAGTRAEPDPRALAVAREVDLQYPSWRPTLEAALFEHYGPYAEALAAGELPAPSEPLPNVAEASQIWPHVSLVFVAVSPLGGVLTTELGYTTVWDEEHTLGARFQNGSFIELCGSVLAP
jgi:hypothetical protein